MKDETIMHIAFFGVVVVIILAMWVTLEGMVRTHPVEEKVCRNEVKYNTGEKVCISDEFYAYLNNLPNLSPECSQIGQTDCYLYVEDSGDISGLRK